MFLEESNPAAYILAVKGGLRSQMILQANLDIVLCTDCVSELLWLPGTVSVTTKSIGLSVDRPIWKSIKKKKKKLVKSLSLGVGLLKFKAMIQKSWH